jgi:hypothetical protein
MIRKKRTNLSIGYVSIRAMNFFLLKHADSILMGSFFQPQSGLSSTQSGADVPLEKGGGGQ